MYIYIIKPNILYSIKPTYLGKICQNLEHSSIDALGTFHVYAI